MKVALLIAAVLAAVMLVAACEETEKKVYNFYGPVDFSNVEDNDNSSVIQNTGSSDENSNDNRSNNDKDTVPPKK